MISNLSYDINSKPLTSEFDIVVNGITISVDSVYFDPKSTYGFILKVNKQLKSVDTILLSYHGTTLKSNTDLPFGAMVNIKVLNNSPLYNQLPGTVQAENYFVNSGMLVETCTDTGAGLDMGNASTGDYLDYLVNVPSDGTYLFEYRVAATAGGTIELRVVDNPLAPIVINTVAVPNTGGWQIWKSVTATGSLSQGTHTLRLFIKQATYNINWFKAALATGITRLDGSTGIEVFPNPVKDQIHFNTFGLNGSYQVKITNLQGVIVQQFTVELQSGTSEQANISALTEGVYIFSIENKSEKYYTRFIKMKN